MTYTVAEAERILAEAKAREAGEPEPLLKRYDKAVAQQYNLGGYSTGHGVGRIAPHRERQAQAEEVAKLRAELEAALAPVQPAPAPSEEDDLRLASEAEVDYEVWRPAFEKWLIEETGIDPDCLSEPSLEWKAFCAGLAAILAERKRAGGVKAEPEWIDWHGGECPVPAGTWVEVRFRGGGGDTDDGAFYRWDHTAHKQNWEIVRYRILGEQP